MKNKYEYNMNRPSPEEWLVIHGYPDYKISNYGRILSMSRTVPVMRKYGLTSKRLPDKVLLPRIVDCGYPIVTLYRDRVGKKHRCHVLVASHFIGERPKGMDVCHNNGDPSDPYLNNLRYGSRLDNINDAKMHGTIPLGEDKTNSVLYNKDVKEIKLMLVENIKTEVIATLYGVSVGAIKSIKSGKSWAHIKNPDGWDSMNMRIVLQESDVFRIHELLKEHATKEVADIIGCSGETISAIRNGRSNKWNYILDML